LLKKRRGRSQGSAGLGSEEDDSESSEEEDEEEEEDGDSYGDVDELGGALL